LPLPAAAATLIGPSWERSAVDCTAGSSAALYGTVPRAEDGLTASPGSTEPESSHLMRIGQFRSSSDGSALITHARPSDTRWR